MQSYPECLAADTGSDSNSLMLGRAKRRAMVIIAIADLVIRLL
jgi:hypothetical protein